MGSDLQNLHNFNADGVRPYHRFFPGWDEVKPGGDCQYPSFFWSKSGFKSLLKLTFQAEPPPLNVRIGCSGGEGGIRTHGSDIIGTIA